jgi:multisubunit Na+/H+ antiporter MnhF subunit
LNIPEFWIMLIILIHKALAIFLFSFIETWFLYKYWLLGEWLLHA